MASADFCFHAELNDFLPKGRRERVFAYPFERRAALKDVIEALGVPHTEVDVILVDGHSVGFEAILGDGERVEVYPWSVAAPIAAPRRLRPRPPARPRFVLDAHLGRLARYLRLLGFDCRYRNDFGDDELAACSAEESRLLLTRDRRLLFRKRIRLAHFVRTDDPRTQLEEVCRVFDLSDAFAPFTRCTACNGRLQPVDKAAIVDRLEPLTRRYVEDFLECDGCGQLYWHGSHVRHMAALVRDLRSASPPLHDTPSRTA